MLFTTIVVLLALIARFPSIVINNVMFNNVSKRIKLELVTIELKFVPNNVLALPIRLPSIGLVTVKFGNKNFTCRIIFLFVIKTQRNCLRNYSMIKYFNDFV